MSNGTLHPLEQAAGPPLVPSVDPARVDAQRQRSYAAYEAFLRGQLERVDAGRPSRWSRDYSSPENYLRSVEPMRTRFQQMLGFWVEPEARLPVRTWDEETLLDTGRFTARRFRLEILPGLDTYAVELVPKGVGRRPGLVAQHGYSGTPELVCGLAGRANLADYSYRSLGLRAVQRGYHVIAVHHPSGYGSTNDEEGGNPAFPQYGRTYGKNRLHRLALLAGGTLFGLDMMGSSRGIDLLMSRAGVDRDRIGMYGLSQGGESALYLPALDQRVRAAVSSAFFNHRYHKLVGPHRATCYLDAPEEDKFFPDVIRCFSDSDVASLIAPRAFAVEAGVKDSSVDFEKSQEEFARAKVHYEKLGLADRVEFIAHAEGHVSATRRAFEFLGKHLQHGV